MAVEKMQSFKWLNWNCNGRKKGGRNKRAKFADINLPVSIIPECKWSEHSNPKFKKLKNKTKAWNYTRR